MTMINLPWCHIIITRPWRQFFLSLSLELSLNYAREALQQKVMGWNISTAINIRSTQQEQTKQTIKQKTTMWIFKFLLPTTPNHDTTLFALLNLRPWDNPDRQRYNDKAVYRQLRRNPGGASVQYPFQIKKRGGATTSMHPIFRIVALGGSLSTIKLCKLAFPQALSERTELGSTLLHTACIYNASVDVIVWIYKQDVDAVKVANRHGYTPLHCACAYGECSIEIFQLLIRWYPKAREMKNILGETPYDAALNNDNFNNCVGKKEMLAILGPPSPPVSWMHFENRGECIICILERNEICVSMKWRPASFMAWVILFHSLILERRIWIGVCVQRWRIYLPLLMSMVWESRATTWKEKETRRPYYYGVIFVMFLALGQLKKWQYTGPRKRDGWKQKMKPNLYPSSNFPCLHVRWMVALMHDYVHFSKKHLYSANGLFSYMRNRWARQKQWLALQLKSHWGRNRNDTKEELEKSTRYK